MRKHSKLTLAERKLLSWWRQEDFSIRECARRLNRHHTTISRELRRNRLDRETYEPLYAQEKAEIRRQKVFASKHPLKNPDVFTYVVDQLRMGWSPEVIAGRLRQVEHPSDVHWHICHETIYAFVYGSKAKLLFADQPLWEYLRRKQKKRRPKTGRKVHRVRIPDRVSIHARPVEVDSRTVFGHWEGDSVVGAGRRSGLHTAYERLSSLIRMGRMSDLTAVSSLYAQRRIYSAYPIPARKTTTVDNGLEHTLHALLNEELGVQTYFADPYSSWQRGGNEHANGLVRCYFPKGTDFNTITDEELADVEHELNSRPRKRLGYLTPLEVFTYHLNRCDRS